MDNRRPQHDKTDFKANDVRPIIQYGIREQHRKEIVKSKYFLAPFERCLAEIKLAAPCGKDHIWSESNFKAFSASILGAIRNRLLLMPQNSALSSALEEAEKYVILLLQEVESHLPAGLAPVVKESIVKAISEKDAHLAECFHSIYAEAQKISEISTDKYLNPPPKPQKAKSDTSSKNTDDEEDEDEDGDDSGDEEDADDASSAEDAEDEDKPKGSKKPKKESENKDHGHFLLSRRLSHFSFFEEDDGIPLAFRTKLNFASHTTRMRDSASKEGQAQYQVEPGRRGLPSNLIGSHSADMIFDVDVIGNGQVTFVAMFWNRKVFGKSLIQWVREGNDEMIAAIVDPFGTTNASESNRMEEYRQIAANFFGVTCASSVEKEETENRSASVGSVSPQVYWLTEDRGEARNDGRNGRSNDFTLVAPMPSLSLSVDITTKLELMRRAGRFLFRDVADVSSVEYTPNANKWKVSATRGYLKSDIAYCRVGGSKPQNVSSLSSVNGIAGYAYLPSLPPRLSQEVSIPRILHFSAIRFFLQRTDVKHYIAIRAKILSNPTGTFYSAVKTHSSGYEAKILDAVFEAWERYTSSYEPGWSAQAGFENLPLDEAMWLDPMRAACELPEGVTDQQFADLTHNDKWSQNLERRLAQAIAKATEANVMEGRKTAPQHLDPNWVDIDTKRWTQTLRFPKAIRAEARIDTASEQA